MSPPVSTARSLVALVLLLMPAAACEEDLSSEEQDELAALQLSLDLVPASPTNRFADVPAAAALGRTLFFERGLSADGTVACVDCHDPARGFSDEQRFSTGVRDLGGARHSMPITSAALMPFLLWDGRADSAWRQPLYALENEREMDFTRVEVAHFVAANHREAYEAVFGGLPDLANVPARARPGDPDWEVLPEAERDAVQRIFVNVGKAIEAYERQLVCVDTRFDRWMRGELELSQEEQEGAAAFVRSGCTACHAGPALSDGRFHNLGLSPADADVIDGGREEGLAILLEDSLHGASVYSDDPVAGGERLTLAAAEARTRGAFRTASLRGVTQRARFGHRGAHRDLQEFIQDTYNRRGRGGRGDGDGDGDRDGNGNGDIVGELDPLLDDVDLDGGAGAIVRFLQTLECPELPATLLEP